MKFEQYPQNMNDFYYSDRFMFWFCWRDRSEYVSEGSVGISLVKKLSFIWDSQTNPPCTLWYSRQKRKYEKSTFNGKLF